MQFSSPSPVKSQYSNTSPTKGRRGTSIIFDKGVPGLASKASIYQKGAGDNVAVNMD